MEKRRDELGELPFSEAIWELGEGEIVRPIYTVPLHEYRLWRYCEAFGLVSYLPLKRCWVVSNRTYKGRQYVYRKAVLRPMFPSYIFVKMTEEQRSLLFKSSSFARLLQVGNEGRFLDELKTIRQIELIGRTEELEFNEEIAVGERFLIESGPWEGVYGRLEEKRQQFNWAVEIECVSGIIRANIDPSLYKLTRVEGD
ncbi:MAG: hypothetical protein IJT83_08055 [Victivallales bacterium]|nr:hypothetical protein [Victivallales bacterium]